MTDEKESDNKNDEIDDCDMNQQMDIRSHFSLEETKNKIE